MLVLEHELLLLIQQQASQNACVRPCLNQTSDVQLLLDLLYSLLLQLQVSAPTTDSGTAE